MSRFPMVATDVDDPIVTPIFDRLKQRWGAVLHLYRVLAWSPALARGWNAFAWTLRFDIDASRRLRELLIVRIAQLLGAEYERGHHLQMAKDEGVTDEQVSALPQWRDCGLFSREDRLVLALADELALTPGATPETMAALQSAFSEKEVVELLVTGSFYCGVARIVNSLQLELEPGHEHLRPRAD